MKNFNKFSIQKYLVLSILFFALLLGSCKRDILLPNRKIIESPLGEIVKDTRFIGDKVVFKIYYKNITNTKANISIVDRLDDGLSRVIVNGGGELNVTDKIIIWEIKDVNPGVTGYVSFAAILNKEGIVINSAHILIDLENIRQIKTLTREKIIHGIKELKLPRKNTIETNKVKVIVKGKPKLGWIPFYHNAVEGSKPIPTIKDETTQDILINFDIPGMWAQEINIQGLTYHQISIPFHANRTSVGLPALPMVGRIVEVPLGVDFSFEIYKKKTIDLKYYNIYPAQEKKIRQHTDTIKPFAINGTAYLNPGLYPLSPVMLEANQIGIIRGHRIIFLKVYPVQFDPITKELLAYSQIEVKIKYNKPGQIDPVNPRIKSDAFEALLQKSIVNYKNYNRFGRENERTEKQAGCDYLIITDGNFHTSANVNDPVERFAQWKRQKGYNTRIVDIANITNGQTAVGLRTYLQNSYDNWYPVPTYVLLIGDAEFIPTNYTDKVGNNTGHPYWNYSNANTGTDLYYTTLDGNDHYPDIFIGRLSVDNQVQTTTIIDKIIAYEQNPTNNANFYTDIPIVQLFEDFNISNGQEDGSFRIIEFAEEINTFLQANAYNPTRIYDQSGTFINGPLQYENGANLPNNLTITGGFQWNGATADIRNAINAGTFLAIYDGHGNRNGWGQPSFVNANVATLTNNNSTPIIFSLACETGWFDNETDDDATLGIHNRQTANNSESFCETFLRQNNGGAVGLIGATRVSYEENDFMMLGMVTAVWPDFDPDPPLRDAQIPEYFHSSLKRLGQINTFSKIFMANAYEDDHLQFELYHVFGDPEMMLWTEAPARFNIDFPKGIGSTGEQDFVVTVKNNATMVPVPNAQVTLTKNGVLIATNYTNPDGVARFSLSGISIGNTTMTVIAANYVPFIDNMIVSANGAQINRLDPQNGIEGQIFYLGGKDFLGTENIKILFGSVDINNTSVAGGAFGQAGTQDFEIRVPTPFNLGPVNVTTYGSTSDRYGVDVFYVRTANPIDLYTYSQWDESTWHLQPGDNPVWNNPEIQLYDAATNNAVESNNLTVGTNYRIKLKIHNDTDFDADNVKVTFKWANFGVGQPDRVWEEIRSTEVDVPNHFVREAEVLWTPGSTGHMCIKAEIYHIEDINSSNNFGQENCHVGPTSSPASISFMVWNPTEKPAMVFLELRQHLDRGTPDYRPILWGSEIIHPNPQLIKPGENFNAQVIINPDFAKGKVPNGQKAYFTLTGYINGIMIGGVDFEIIKK